MSAFKSLTASVALALAVAAFALSSGGTASAQNVYGAGQPFGSSNHTQPVAQARAFTGATQASPSTAARFNNTAYRIIQGDLMIVVVYAMNGACEVTMGGRTRGFRMTSQACQYSVRDLGPGKIEMTSSITFNGQTQRDTGIMHMRRDGSLFEPKSRGVMVRIQ
ncbi:MAG: hypothetical protein AAGJ32_06655 [Pseudomonadota bacterium]